MWAWSVAAAVVLAAIGVGVGFAVSGSGAGSTKAAATSLLRSSLAAAEAAGSFHYVSTSTSSTSTSSSLTQQTVGDAGSTEGTQVITISGDTFYVDVVGSTAYFEGDASAMVSILGVPVSVAEDYAGKWISLVSGDAPYQSVEIAVTTSSALDQNVTFAPKRELGSSRIDGTTGVGLQGPMTPVDGQAAHGTATLYVAATGRHLPLRYLESGTVGSGSNASKLKFSITFSGWGENVSVPVPAGAVPFSSLGASGSTGPSGPTLIT